MSVPSRDQFLHTETFNSLINSSYNLSGGASRKSSIKSKASRMSKASRKSKASRRSAPSPGDPLHKEAIDYLKEQGLPDLDARAYKSIAYRTIKEQHPEAKHLERAQMMLALVKEKNFMKDFSSKLEDTKKILENIDSEKEKRKTEEDKENKQAGGAVDMALQHFINQISALNLHED
jgi:hypothetical protein